MDDAPPRSPSTPPATAPTGPDRPSAAGFGIPPSPSRGVFALLPGLWVLRNYRRGWLGKDLTAGLVLTGLLVPAGMGYAEAAGLPAITGLYATIVPLLAYALVGPSRIMVLGPDSALAALVSAAVLGLGNGDVARTVALASALALLTGALCVVAGLLRAGFLTDLLSKPVRVGYMNGIALTVAVTQLPKLLGFSSKASGVLDGARAVVKGALAGKIVPAAAGLGVGALLAILALRRLAPRWPGILFAMVGATLVVRFLGWDRVVAVVGPVPRGVPAPALPLVQLADLAPLATAAVGIALVSFADTSVLSRTYAGRGGYRVDPDRELVGLGVANLAAGLFQGFPVSSSASRTPVAESAGSRTQLTGVVGALAITLLLVAAPRLTSHVPTAALAAVVIAAALRIFDFTSLRVFARVRRSDFVLSIVAFLAVATLGVIPGIALSVGVSILDFVRRAWRPHDAVLGRARGVKGYHDLRRYPDARTVPGLVLFRWDAPLFFANADTFRARVLEVVDASFPPPSWVVVAAEPITDVDTTAAEMIEELDTELGNRGVELAFAEMKDPVKDRLERYGLQARIGPRNFFPTVGVAVKAYLEQHDVAWEDWGEG